MPFDPPGPHFAHAIRIAGVDVELELIVLAALLFVFAYLLRPSASNSKKIPLWLGVAGVLVTVGAVLLPNV